MNAQGDRSPILPNIPDGTRGEANFTLEDVKNLALPPATFSQKRLFLPDYQPFKT